MKKTIVLTFDDSPLITVNNPNGNPVLAIDIQGNMQGLEAIRLLATAQTQISIDYEKKMAEFGEALRRAEGNGAKPN